MLSVGDTVVRTQTKYLSHGACILVNRNKETDEITPSKQIDKVIAGGDQCYGRSDPTEHSWGGSGGCRVSRGGRGDSSGVTYEQTPNKGTANLEQNLQRAFRKKQ